MTYKGNLHVPDTMITHLRDARNRSPLGVSIATATQNNSHRHPAALVRPLFQRSQTLYLPSRNRLFLLHTFTRRRLLHHLIREGTAACPKLLGGRIHLRDLETGLAALTPTPHDQKLPIPRVFRNAQALAVSSARDQSNHIV